MKRADLSQSGDRIHPGRAPRASESQTRLASSEADDPRLGRVHAPAAQPPVPAARAATRRPPADDRLRPPAAEGSFARRGRSDEEPRTGVVRRVQLVSASQAQPGGARAEGARSRPGGKPAPAPTPARAARGSREWRCLEWGAGPRRPARDPSLTVAQLSVEGELIRQSGPDAWLGEASEFMHRMAALVAQGLGHSRCRSLCLKGASGVVSVSESSSKVVALSGPPSAMASVLRRAGLE